MNTKVFMIAAAVLVIPALAQSATQLPEKFRGSALR
jgi:hypothetical protein